jgi:hypothetical protein
MIAQFWADWHKLCFVPQCIAEMWENQSGREFNMLIKAQEIIDFAKMIQKRAMQVEKMYIPDELWKQFQYIALKPSKPFVCPYHDLGYPNSKNASCHCLP